jgi:hypothetical protein
LVEEVQKCFPLKLDSILLIDESPVDKEKFNLKKKYPKSDVYELN